MSHKKIYISNICIPLIIGVFFYLLFRPNIFLSKTIYMILDINYSFALYDLIIGNIVGRILVNYLCDFLWAYSLSWALFYIKDLYNHSILKTMCYCIIADCLMELLQLIDCIGGTFDYCDIIVQILATLVVLILYKSILHKGEGEKENGK